MKNRQIFVVWLVVALTQCTVVNAQRYGIIPQPQSVVEKEGEFRIDGKTVFLVSAGDSSFVEIAENFAAQIKAVSGMKIRVKDGEDKQISKTVVFAKKNGMGQEEYTLQVDPQKIIISASYPNGLFYGVQTICQLLPSEIYGTKQATGIKWVVPCCEIKDAPKFSYRGMMLDVGRYFMPKEFIMKFIDLLAMHKQNVFHWHLTEDQGWRVEIKKYPKLTEVGAWRKETTGYQGAAGDGKPHGGFYTQEDIREVVEYARQRYVTIIPEIELPGHSSAAIAAYPELSCFPERKYEVPTGWGIKKDVFCPNAKTFTFLEDVFTELFDLFPSPYYHIGGDECPKDRWKESAYCQDLKKVLGAQTEDELQIFFVQRMDKFLREKGGKKVIGWDEILDGGAVPSSIVMSYRGHAPAIKALNRDMYTILTPNRWCYLDYYQEDPEKEVKSQGLFLPLKKVYDYYPISDTVPANKHKFILGMQGCIWTEFIQNSQRVEYMAFPRTIAMSEVAWCDKSNKNWTGFCERMVKEFKRLDQKEVGYSKAFYNVVFNFDRTEKFPKELILSLDMPESVIRYTTDGSAPTVQSQVYKESLTVKEGDCIRAQGFTTQGKSIGVEVNKIFK
ncbi:MAG: family 20 glycosylhydrolase [Dysgonamonadaceae bacterium]|jgi:hexosaminidase|nr:family 20 glycosylhydrolase [Dysgonamonadaceae bacterium]